MSDFEKIYDDMSKNYQNVDQMIELLYPKVTTGIANDDEIKLFKGLLEHARSLVIVQMDLVMCYPDENLKKSLINILEAKLSNLDNTIEEYKSKNL